MSNGLRRTPNWSGRSNGIGRRILVCQQCDAHRKMIRNGRRRENGVVDIQVRQKLADGAVVVVVVVFLRLRRWIGCGYFGRDVEVSLMLNQFMDILSRTAHPEKQRRQEKSCYEAGNHRSTKGEQATPSC